MRRFLALVSLAVVAACGGGRAVPSATHLPATTPFVHERVEIAPGVVLDPLPATYRPTVDERHARESAARFAPGPGADGPTVLMGSLTDASHRQLPVWALRWRNVLMVCAGPGAGCRTPRPGTQWDVVDARTGAVIVTYQLG